MFDVLVYINTVTIEWACTFPTAIKPLLLGVKRWKLFLLSSGIDSAPEQKWRTNNMSNVFSSLWIG